jgi:hypothetical protein
MNIRTMSEMSGAKALMTSLEKEGVDIVFGLPGGANLPIYDALVDANFRHVLVRHEQSAAQLTDMPELRERPEYVLLRLDQAQLIWSPVLPQRMRILLR